MTSPTLLPSLDRVASRASRALRSGRARTALRAALDDALPLAIFAPMLAGLAELGRFATGAPGPIVHWAWIAVGAVALPVGFLLIRFVMARLAPVDRRAALVLAGRHVNDGERLVTADEFLNEPERSSFMEAAIEDATQFVDPALGDAPHVRGGGWRAGRRGLLSAILAVVLVIGVAWLGGVSIPPGETGTAGEMPRAVVAAITPTLQRDDATVPPVRPAERPRTPTDQEKTNRRSATRRAADLGSLPEQTREAEGRLGTGQAAEAETADSPGASRGAPSSQGQPSRPDRDRKPKDAKPRKPGKPAAEPPEQPKSESEEPAGSTAGQGASRGSNRNPAVSDWSSRDHVSTPDDDEVADDEDIEDEEESEEARGGVQPSLRDRKPPVNRDLRIGFGNQKNPDANGRGGPSAQKKSRGVASLVLGVPIPDRIKGQPNAGKTKVTQQRIEPDREEPDAIAAGERTPRSGPVGAVSRPGLSPWMRDVIRTYFIQLREQPDPVSNPGESRASDEEVNQP